jgi:predicted phosphodiesterase
VAWYRDEETLRAEVQKHGSLSGAARANKTPEPTVRHWGNKYQIKGSHSHTAFAFRAPPPPPLVPIEDAELRLEGDFSVSNDWHAPLIHYDTFHRYLEDTYRHGLERMVVVGDMTNQDALAQHEDKQAGAGMGPEMQHLHYAVETALDVVKEIIVTFGNHDRHHAQKARVSFEKSIRMLLCDLPPEKLDRIKVTARDYVIVDTEEGEWRLCHTRSYSRLPLAYPDKLAKRWMQHIYGAHRHHLAQGFAANGKMIVDGGMIADQSRMAYLHKYTNDLPKMQNGYSLLIGGRMHTPMLYS